MSYIRFSVAQVRSERAAEVCAHFEQLVAYQATLPGFVAGWVLTGHGETGACILDNRSGIRSSLDTDN